MKLNDSLGINKLQLKLMMMKKLLLGMFLLAISQLFAVTHTITVKNQAFVPSTLTAEVGDEIKWVWESGTHTTSSLDIPSGADTWSEDMESTSTEFTYTVTKEGTYNYQCNPHSGSMQASITVVKKTSTTHTITVKNFAFEPSTLTAEVGDEIKWVWESGTHTTSSLDIPSGAGSWSEDMESTSTEFTYTVTKEGTYNYQCNPHSTTMKASITVVKKGTPTGLDLLTENNGEVYPNPFNNELVIKNVGYTKYQLLSVTGALIEEGTLELETINTSKLQKGSYLLILFREEKKEKMLRLLKN